jgi:uncharacterized protein involved in exopolysaccharide biosynthesis
MSQGWGDDKQIDLRQIIAAIWAHKAWIFACVVLCTVPLSAIAILSEPIYRAATVVVPTTSERNSLSGTLSSALAQVGGLATLAGLSAGSGDSTTEEALAVLRSRDFTERFIADLNLMPVLFADAWDPATRTWKSPDNPPTLARGSAYFDSQIRRVTRDRQTGLVTLQIEWRDREVAAQWANELIRRLNEEMRSRAIEKTQASMTFLEQELAGTTIVGTREAINRLIENQIRERMLANVTHEYVFRVVDAALAPDAGDPVRPNKLMLLLAGPLLGFAFGVVGVVAWASFARDDARKRPVGA